MAEEPENLILSLLRDVRAKQDEHSRMLAEHGRRLEHIDQRLEEAHETLYTVAGAAVHANVRHDTTTERLKALEERVDRLEEKA